jgi:hypothetical protein
MGAERALSRFVGAGRGERGQERVDGKIKGALWAGRLGVKSTRKTKGSVTVRQRRAQCDFHQAVDISSYFTLCALRGRR